MKKDEVILASVKKLLSGIPPEDTDFDDNILDAINSAFAKLFQIGCPSFAAEPNSKWGEFSTDPMLLGLCSCYVNNEVRLIFDPPQQNSLLESTKNLRDEYYQRISYLVDPGGNGGA